MFLTNMPQTNTISDLSVYIEFICSDFYSFWTDQITKQSQEKNLRLTERAWTVVLRFFSIIFLRLIAIDDILEPSSLLISNGLNLQKKLLLYRSQANFSPSAKYVSHRCDGVPKKNNHICLYKIYFQSQENKFKYAKKVNVSYLNIRDFHVTRHGTLVSKLNLWLLIYIYQSHT